MRKYALTMMLTLFSAVMLGSYYVYSAVDRMPQFRLVTLQGDERLVQSLILEGTYDGRYHTEGISVTVAGSDYHSKRSFWQDEMAEGRSWVREEADIAQLLDEYRGFMRGKGHLDQFYQDEEFVIYAGANRMEVLHKADGRTERFQWDLQTDGSYFVADPVDVQRIGDEVHLLTRVFYREKPEEIWLVVLDRKDGTLIRSEPLLAEATLDEDIRLLRLLSDDRISAPNEHAVIILRPYTEDGAGRKERLLAYHYPTGQITELPSDWTGKPLADEVHQNWILDGNRLYRYQYNRQMVNMSIYSIDTEETESWSVNVEDLGANGIQNARYENGSIYVLYHNEKDLLLSVFDAATGEPLYLGQITAEDAEHNAFSWIGSMKFRY